MDAPSGNEITALRDPDQLDLAVKLAQQGRSTGAEAIMREFAAARAAPPEVLVERGRLLIDAVCSAKPMPFLEESLRLDPDMAQACNDLGIALMKLRRHDEAALCFKKFAELWPDFADAHGNLGKVCYVLQRPGPAEHAFRRTLEIAPGLPAAWLGLGMTLLLAGKYEEGWKCYSWRFQANGKFFNPPAAIPRWHGETLKGRSILILQEQGLGDEIMAVRYAAKLRELGAARVSWVCSPSLRDIFWRVKGISEMPTGGDGKRVSAHDYCCAAMDLPGLCGTGLDDIPNKLPYISVDARRHKKWKKCLPSRGMKVGLVWKGDPKHLNDANRSLDSLEMLAPLWQVQGVTFVSLQKGAGSDEASRPRAGQPLIHLGGGLRDFSDTAAIIDQLDLVIGVDTSVAHVAGALGKPVWVLLPFELVDWRWLIGRDDSPWYPGVMRLFRQGKNEPWSTVIARVAVALAEVQRSL